MFVSEEPTGTEVNCADEAVTVVDTVNEPVMLDDPSEKNPFFMRNSFGISFPYPR
jgi:hypothetical protein